jgi:hypothetical protein
MPVLPPSGAQMEREAIELIGVNRAGILKDRTPGRICGLLTARGRNTEWEKALEHISEHFRPNIAGKEKHSVFRKKFRDSDTLKDIIKRAASRPSMLRVSRLRDDWGRPIFGPCLLIIREFQEPPGEEMDQVFLVVVANDQGTLVTAFPATKSDVFG